VVVIPGGRLPSSQNFENYSELYLIRHSNITKQVELISCLFTTSPEGWAAGRLKESKIRLTQPSLGGTGAELGNMLKLMTFYSLVIGLLRARKRIVRTILEWLD
jgi:hypothetical protein